jgi:hypothetical protein
VQGKLIFPNGDVYEGEFEKDLPHGEGKYIFSNGSVYEGEFAKGHLHGHGQFHFPEVRRQCLRLLPCAYSRVPPVCAWRVSIAYPCLGLVQQRLEARGWRKLGLGAAVSGSAPV